MLDEHLLKPFFTRQKKSGFQEMGLKELSFRHKLKYFNPYIPST